MRRVSASLLIMLFLFTVYTTAFAGKRAADVIMPEIVDINKFLICQEPDDKNKKSKR